METAIIDQNLDAFAPRLILLQVNVLSVFPHSPQVTEGHVDVDVNIVLQEQDTIGLGDLEVKGFALSPIDHDLISLVLVRL